MKRRVVIIALVCLFIKIAYGVQILPVNPTPQPNHVTIRIAYPESIQCTKTNPVYVQVRLQGYALGTNSIFPRANQIPNSDRGQSLHIVVDNKPYFPVSNPGIDPYDETSDYFEESYKFLLPFDLEEGVHSLRIYCARSFGESIKGKNSFATTYFSIGGKKENRGVKLQDPLLTFNEPSMRFFYEADKPVLLDFLLANCNLSKDGYTLRVVIDKKFEEILTSWQPYYILDLQRGMHTISLELLDPLGNPVNFPDNSIERVFIVH